jgi:hypothetical protein
MSLSQKIAFFDFLAYLPALTVMVIIRRDLGYRVINPLHIFGVTAFLFIVGSFYDPSYPDHHLAHLKVFAVIVFCFAAVQRLKRRIEMKRGTCEHSYYIGTSVFDAKWLPEVMRRNRIMARFADPLLCAFMGLILNAKSPTLSHWLFFSALSLMVTEQVVRKKQKVMELDMMDSLIASQHQGNIVREFEQPPSRQPQQPAAGVPTGVGSDIQRQIKRRRNP